MREAFLDLDLGLQEHDYDVHRPDPAPHQRTPIPARLTGILCYNMLSWFLYSSDVASQGLTCDICDVRIDKSSYDGATAVVSGMEGVDSWPNLLELRHLKTSVFAVLPLQDGQSIDIRHDRKGMQAVAEQSALASTYR